LRGRAEDLAFFPLPQYRGGMTAARFLSKLPAEWAVPIKAANITGE
jgi:hypothetical protein